MSDDVRQAPRVIVALDFAEPDARARARRAPRSARLRRSRSARSCSSSPGPSPCAGWSSAASRLPRSQVPRHSEHRRAGVRGGDAARRLDAERARRRRARDARGGARRGRRDRGGKRGAPPPLLIAVTVLTSLGDDDLRDDRASPTTPRRRRCGSRGSPRDCGLDGVVCSAQEAPALRAAFGPDFKLVTPGIRPAGSGARRSGAHHHAARRRSPTAPTTS